MDLLHSAELDLILDLQKLTNLAGFLKMASYFGLEIFWWLIPLVYLSVERRTGTRLFFVYLVSLAFVHILKLLFHSPRPYWIDSRVLVMSVGGGFGMPSGHVLLATSVWLFLAIAARRRVALVSALIVILLVSTSRVYLGAHFISDVIGGWIAGVGIVYTVLVVEPKATDSLGRLSPWQQIGVACYSSAVILLFGMGARMIAAEAIQHQAWADFSVNALNLDDFIVSTGGIFGLGVGLAMVNHWMPDRNQGTWVVRGIRVVYGLSGLYLIRTAPGMTLPQSPEFLRSCLLFLQGALASWWIVFLAPWFLACVGLAQPRFRLSPQPSSHSSGSR